MSRFGASQRGCDWQLRSWERDIGVSTNASDCLGVFFGGLCEVCYLDDGIEQMQIHITELRGRIGSLVVHWYIGGQSLMTMSTVMFDTCLARSMKRSLPSGKAMSPTRTLQLLPCHLHRLACEATSDWDRHVG